MEHIVISYEIKSISISSPCHFYFVLYCFICFFGLRCRSSFHYGRFKADVHRTSCGLRFATVGTKRTSTGCPAPLYFPLSEFVNNDGRYNTRETIRGSTPATNPVFSRVSREFNNEIHQLLNLLKQVKSQSELL